MGLGELHSTEVAYLLLTQQPWVRFSPYLRIFLLMLLRFMDWIESGQRLDNVNGTHLVLASGKLVLQKNKKVPDKTQQGTWWMP